MFGTKVRERLTFFSSVFSCCIISATSKTEGKISWWRFRYSLPEWKSGLLSLACAWERKAGAGGGRKKNKSAKRKQGKSIRRMFLLLRNVFSKGGRFVLDCLPWRTGIYAGRHEKRYFFVAEECEKKCLFCVNFGLLLLFEGIITEEETEYSDLSFTMGYVQGYIFI